MARGRDLPVEVRNLIVHHRKEGKSLAEIADIVKKVVQQYKKLSRDITYEEIRRLCGVLVALAL